MHKNELTQEIPKYLMSYVATQDSSLYTPMDHASWRFILKISREFFTKHAHQKYLDGLRETGISMDRIPLIKEMDACLRRFNWQAVPVVGFIPPAAFMEFLSLGVLPIACDMRSIEHLAYTPAPDIVHEAAGHAPIIADPEYADYLRSYGEISRKAIYSSQDMDVYQAIRYLSDTKGDPRSTPQQIQGAQDRLDQAIAAVSFDSEATLLSRMGWWTFEYGLVGSLDQPKIYGAGLLSSMGESYQCLTPAVKKIPFSVDCVRVSYDITRPQPQLFVAPSFQDLKDALEQLANQMAFRQGDLEGVKKAKQAGTVTTIELDTKIQVSGVLVDFIQDSTGRVCYLRFSGPSQLSYEDQELPGQGGDYHREGYSSPIEPVTHDQLQQAGLGIGKKGTLRFRSGIEVEGKLTALVEKNKTLVLLTFEDCTVRRGDQILFRPEWGTFDMICGEKVTSVFAGAADRSQYFKVTEGFQQEPARQTTNLTSENKALNQLYLQVRTIREKGKFTEKEIQELKQIHEKLEKHYPKDWLLRYELLELAQEQGLKMNWEPKIKSRFTEISAEAQDKAEMIRRGLKLLN
jgi:phenylalanine-4-hydroxylase